MLLDHEEFELTWFRHTEFQCVFETMNIH